MSVFYIVNEYKQLNISYIYDVISKNKTYIYEDDDVFKRIYVSPVMISKSDDALYTIIDGVKNQ